MSEQLQVEASEGSVLFVDDEQAILNALKRLMRKQPMKCWYAKSGSEGLEILAQHPVDLVVSDMRMPEMTGDVFLARVREEHPDTLRYLLTGQSDMESTIAALNKGGISRFIHKPWSDEEFLTALCDGVRIARLQTENNRLIAKTLAQSEQLQTMNLQLEERVNERTSMLRKAMRQLETSYDAFVRSFAHFISHRPSLIRGQSQQVSDLCGRLCDTLSIDGAEKKHIVYAALLHEAGKLAMPETMLSRSEVRLTSRDYETYRQYPVIGEMALGGIKTLEKSSLLIRHQNEYFDGSGFPENLAGNSIPLGARILLVCKHYIGLQSEMMRQTPLSQDEALTVLRQQSGKLYDPVLVSALAGVLIATPAPSAAPHERIVRIHELEPGMVLQQDLVTERGVLLMSKDQEITFQAILRLRRIREFYGFDLPIHVINHDSRELAE